MNKIDAFTVSDASKYQTKTYKNGKPYYEYVIDTKPEVPVEQRTKVTIFPKGTASEFEGAKFVEKADGSKIVRVDNGNIFRKLADGTTQVFKRFSDWQIEQAKAYIENIPKEFSEAIKASVLRGKF